MRKCISAILVLSSLVSSLAFADPNKDLLNAALNGDINALKQSLNEGANPNYAQDTYTPLMAAANNGFDDIARTLLDKGANVNAVKEGECGYTAIWLAAYTGRDSTVSLLAERGANLNAAGGCENETPLQIAQRYSRASTVSLIESLGGAHSGKVEDVR